MGEKVSDSSLEMRKMIESAIEDQKISRDEYDQIIHIATEDGYLDRHEQTLLKELQQMIDDKVIKFVVK